MIERAAKQVVRTTLYDTVYANDDGYGRWADRHNHFLAYAKQVLRPGNRVLDVGCGRGALIKALCDAGFDATGFDPSRVALADFKRENQNLAKRAWEGESISWQGIYDAIVCSDVLEHLEEDHAINLFEAIAKGARPHILVSVGVEQHTHDRHGDLHETVRPASWWRELFAKHMDIKCEVHQGISACYFGEKLYAQRP